MIGEFPPGACRSWFETMYELRNKWVPLYVKKYFWAGMSTTQRSESMNAFFKDFITKHTTLFIFVGKVDQALREKFEKEHAEDFRSANRTPSLVSHLSFELQFAQAYTHRMFYIFQHEVKKLIACCVVSEMVQDDMTVYVVNDGFGDKSYEVQYCLYTDQYHCECLLFQFKGIVCRHALAVYKQVALPQIPDCYVLARWRKDYIRTHTRFELSNRTVHRDMSLYDDLYSRAHAILLSLVECSYRDQAATADLLSSLEKLSLNVVEELEHENPITNIIPEPADIVLDPLKRKCVGRPRTARRKPGYEKGSALNGRTRQNGSASRATSSQTKSRTSINTFSDYAASSNMDLMRRFSNFNQSGPYA
ncbi:hypothetical protein LUZ60_007707 [Juncus effusus]|nr:hypothetical protein LUZ60_007707 [Juncus effusus]